MNLPTVSVPTTASTPAQAVAPPIIVPQHWRQIGGPADSLAVHGDRLAALTPDRQAVYSFNPSDDQWIAMGSPAHSLIGGGWDLHAVTPDVWRWNGLTWNWIGGPGAQFVAIGAGLYGLTPNRDAVLRYDRYDNSWTKIGGPAASLVAGGSKLYAVRPDGQALMEYSRYRRTWTRIGGPGAQFVGVGGTVYGLTPARDAAYRYEGIPDQWSRVGGPAERLIGGGSVLYAVQPGTRTTWRYSGSGEAWTEIGKASGHVAVGRTLYALTSDRTAVMEYDPVNGETRRLRGLMRKAYNGSPHEGRMRRGFLVKRLGGSVIAQHQAGTIFQPLSILKTLSHAHAAMQIDRGLATLDTMVGWREDRNDDDRVCFGSNDQSQSGSAPLRDAMPASMWFSHNRSAEALLNHFTVREITSRAQDLGMRETEIYLRCGDGTPGGWWAHNMSTLEDLARLFEGMEGRSFVSTTGRDVFRDLMIEKTPGPGTSYTSPILGQTTGPESSEFLRTIVAREAGSAKQGIVDQFMKHILIRFKAGGGNPTAGEFGYGEFFQLDLPVKGGGGVQIHSYLLGWYLNQLHAPIVGADSPELAEFKNALFRQPIRQALYTW